MHHVSQGVSPIDEVVAAGVCLETVRSVRACDAFFVPFLLSALPRWASLQAVHLPNAGMTQLPETLLSDLPLLRVLVLDNNKLTTLPSLAPRASCLRLLSADKNQLTALPHGLVACTQLEVLSLEHNKLVRPIVDLRPLGGCLRELRLGGNPLDYLPELSHCVALRRLSLANARICAAASDAATADWLATVEVTECRLDDAGAPSGVSLLLFSDEELSHVDAPGSATVVVSDAAGSSGSVTAALFSRVAGLTGSFSSSGTSSAPPASGGQASTGGVAQGGPSAIGNTPVAASQGAPGSSAAASGASASGTSPATGPDYSAFYALIFRFSSCQLPLLASAVARLAQEPSQAEAMAAAEGGVQQLLSMALSDNDFVVSRACATLACLAQSPATANKLLAARAAARLLALLRAHAPGAQCAALRVIAALAWASSHAALQLSVEAPPQQQQQPAGGVSAPPQNSSGVAGPTALLQRVAALCGSRHSEVAVCALEALGNLAAHAPDAASTVRSLPGVIALLTQLACGAAACGDGKVRCAAIRALALLGYNDAVAEATGRPRCCAPGRGLRILVMDGGGMRGLATVRQLRQLEARTGKRIHQLFDLIGGTSTGGVLAVALGMHGHDLDTCEALYRHLGSQVFSTSASREDTATWQARLGALYGSASSQLRVAVSGCKHDAAVFERLMREACAFFDGATPEEREPCLIDTAARGGPAVFVVATCMSVSPAVPFVFRNYQPDVAWSSTSGQRHPGWNEAGAVAPPPGRGVKPGTLGSCTHRVWHAVRASSAAPYYLADFCHGGLRWQDGAVLVNNPAALALEEASLRWPGVPVDVLVSCGSGNIPVKLRDASTISRFVDAGAVLVESACDVHRTDDVLQLLAPAAGIQYYRFNPVDERCAVELDELDEGLLRGLCDATVDYCTRNAHRFDACAAALCAGVVASPPMALSSAEVRNADSSELQPPPPPCLADAARAARATRLAQESARKSVSVGASKSSDVQGAVEADSYEGPHRTTPIKGSSSASRLNGGASRSGIAVFDAPRMEPGSAQPLVQQGRGWRRHADGVMAACTSASVPFVVTDVSSPVLTPPEVAAALRAALQGGCEFVHWAGYGTPCTAAASGSSSSEQGLVLAWRTDVTAVAEPSDAATAFVASIAQTSSDDGDSGGHQSALWSPNYSPGGSAQDPPRRLADILTRGVPFDAGGVLHEPLGATSLVAPPTGGPDGVPPSLVSSPQNSASGASGTAILSAVFRRTLPARVLTPDDVRLGTAGVWGPPASSSAAMLCARPCPLAFCCAVLDAGAVAVLTWMPSPQAAPATESQLGDFFGMLYDDLLTSSTRDDAYDAEPATLAERIARASAIAASQVTPSAAAERLRHAVRVLALRNGCVVALRAAQDASIISAERVPHPGVAALVGGATGGGGSYYAPPFTPVPATPATPRSSSTGGGGPLSPTSPGAGDAALSPSQGGARRIW